LATNPLNPRLRRRALRVLPAILLALGLIGAFSSPGAQAAGGGVLGWGQNAFGQLGNGAPSTEPECHCIDTPVPVAGIATATQIAAGEDHAVALLAGGTVAAWGANSSGEVGDGTTEPRPAPVPILGLAGVIAVAAGANHNLALLSNGTVVAWGDNVNGELGNGVPGGSSTVPVAVPGLSGVVAISAGFRYNLALLADGTVRAWGYDKYAQVGTPVAAGGCECIAVPTPVPGVTGAMAISAGANGAMALLSNGTVMGWGFDPNGQLGFGPVPSAAPCLCAGPVPIAGPAGVKTISDGGNHALALLGTGGVESWGANQFGQLGNGTTTTIGCECVPTPAAVGGLAGLQGVAAGGTHSLALLLTGGVDAWGDNAKGQLGIPAPGSAVPVPVAGVAGASEVAASDSDSFALTAPAQPLKIELTGDGSGAVGGPGILCPSACEGRYPQGQVEVLRAQPTPGVLFAGFTGPCAGTATCLVAMEAGQIVTATFGRPKGTKITKAKINRRSDSARFSFTAPGAITGYQCKFLRPKPITHPSEKGGGKGKGGKKRSLAAHGKPKGGGFTSCKAPVLYRHLLPGHYVFKVRALDIVGPDRVPASRSFTIKP
jgi:alpha-tubulin suppressor-like RCC1 family protein